MAIQTTIDTKFGTIVDAYCRLEGIHWDVPALEITLVLKIFVSREARDALLEPVDIKYYYLPVVEALSSSEGGNVIGFSYKYMKLIDEIMARGTDV